MADNGYEAIVIGTSMGGMQILKRLLSSLPADYPLPVIVVQHLDGRSPGMLAELLDNFCAIRVKEADEKECIKAGTVYIAPANYHLLIEQNRTFSLTVEERVNYARPAIDVLFETAADAYGAGLVGLVLTGANHDGARGLKYIRDKGGLAVAQDPETAEATRMPHAAIQSAQPQKILTPDGIEQLLKEFHGEGRKGAV